LVMHGPSLRDRLAPEDWEAWHAIVAAERAGQTRLSGVSNVSLPQLVELCENAGAAPAFVQKRCFAANRWDADVRSYCRPHDIVYQAFSLLTANRRELG